VAGSAGPIAGQNFGAGNAALSAAVSAKENGAKRVLVLEKAPREMRGGNTHWAGAVRLMTLSVRLSRIITAVKISNTSAIITTYLARTRDAIKNPVHIISVSDSELRILSPT